MRRRGWPKATFRRLTLASGSTTSCCRRWQAATPPLTASHEMRSGRWRVASSRDALLFLLRRGVGLTGRACHRDNTSGGLFERPVLPQDEEATPEGLP